MTEQPIALGHRLSDEDWAKVVHRAAEVRREIAEASEGGASGVGGIVVDMTARCVASKKYFPVSGIPTQLLVLHSAECPLQAGFAISLTEWFSATVYPTPPIASWQRFVDPVHRVRAVPDELGAWHASEANVLSIGWEQAGYARFSRAEWLTPNGQIQLELLAFDMAEVARRDGIPPRWLSTTEVEAVTHLGNRSIKGFCTHRQIDPDTRTDPGNGYPYDLLMSRIEFYMGGGAIAPHGTTQEEELSQAAEENIARIRQILEAVESDRIRERITAIDDRTAILVKLLKGEYLVKGADDATLYELMDDGTLRGIGGLEWAHNGKPYVTYAQEVVDGWAKTEVTPDE